MSATHDRDRTTSAPAPLYLAFELGWTSWGLAFSTASALPPRRVTIPARDLASLRRSRTDSGLVVAILIQSAERGARDRERTARGGRPG